MADNGNGEITCNCEDLLIEQNNILEGIAEDITIISDLSSQIEFFMNTIYGYAYIYIPLAVIVMILWWFFKQFLYTK